MLVVAAVVATLLLSACGEQVQTVPVAGQRKSDQNAWAAGASSPYVAPGWTPGNEASWDSQIRRRTQGQNDYSPRI